jgi:hypothetical protein
MCWMCPIGTVILGSFDGTQVYHSSCPALLYTTRCSLYTTRKRLTLLAVLEYTYLLPSASPAYIHTAVSKRLSCMSLMHTCMHPCLRPCPSPPFRACLLPDLRPDPSAPSLLPASERRVDDSCAPPASPSRVARFVNDCRASLASITFRCRHQLPNPTDSQLTDAATSPAAHHHIHLRSRHQHHHRR